MGPRSSPSTYDEGVTPEFDDALGQASSSTHPSCREAGFDPVPQVHAARGAGARASSGSSTGVRSVHTLLGEPRANRAAGSSMMDENEVWINGGRGDGATASKSGDRDPAASNQDDVLSERGASVKATQRIRGRLRVHGARLRTHRPAGLRSRLRQGRERLLS